MRCCRLPALLVTKEAAIQKSSSDEEEVESPTLGRFRLDRDKRNDVSVVSHGENSISIVIWHAIWNRIDTSSVS